MWKTTKLALAGTGVAFIILMFGVVGYAIGDTARLDGEHTTTRARRRKGRPAKATASSTKSKAYCRRTSWSRTPWTRTRCSEGPSMG